MRADYSKYGEIEALARHPLGPGELLGAVGVLDVLPAEVDAVASLCRNGSEQVPARVAAPDQVQVWPIDREAP